MTSVANIIPKDKDRRLVFWAGIGVLCISSFFFIGAWQTRDWQTGFATVTQAEVRSDNPAEDKPAIVTYSVDDKTYISPHNTSSPKGNAVPISYDPENPEKITATSRGALASGVTFVILGLLFSVGAILANDKTIRAKHS